MKETSISETDRTFRTALLAQDLLGTVINFWQKSNPPEQREDREALINYHDTLVAFGVAAGQVVAQLPPEKRDDYLCIILGKIDAAVKQSFMPEGYTQ